MSGIKVLEFGNASTFGNLEFPDLEEHLEKRLAAIKSATDLEQLLKIMNPLLRNERFSSEERETLKRLRQRAYDRKRHATFMIPKSTTQSRRSKLSPPDLEPAKSGNINESEGQKSAHRKIHTIDPVTWLKNIAHHLVWLVSAALVSFFVWHQSLGLYQSAGFVSATYAATGGILMLVGFAACHAITRSALALLLCIYATAYEGYLMVSGTFTDDRQIHTDTVQNDPELGFLQEKMEREKANYHELKLRYDNPESKIFKNEWFLKTHLNPAWDASSEAHEAYLAKKSSLIATVGDKHVTWLKILYRLGLVFLCMMLVHGFFDRCTFKKSATVYK